MDHVDGDINPMLCLGVLVSPLDTTSGAMHPLATMHAGMLGPGTVELGLDWDAMRHPTEMLGGAAKVHDSWLGSGEKKGMANC